MLHLSDFTYVFLKCAISLSIVTSASVDDTLKLLLSFGFWLIVNINPIRSCFYRYVITFIFFNFVIIVSQAKVVYINSRIFFSFSKFMFLLINVFGLDSFYSYILNYSFSFRFFNVYFNFSYFVLSYQDFH